MFHIIFIDFKFLSFCMICNYCSKTWGYKIHSKTLKLRIHTSQEQINIPVSLRYFILVFYALFYVIQIPSQTHNIKDSHTDYHQHTELIKYNFLMLLLLLSLLLLLLFVTETAGRWMLVLNSFKINNTTEWYFYSNITTYQKCPSLDGWTAPLEQCCLLEKVC